MDLHGNYLYCIPVYCVKILFYIRMCTTTTTTTLLSSSTYFVFSSVVICNITQMVT